MVEVGTVRKKTAKNGAGASKEAYLLAGCVDARRDAAVRTLIEKHLDPDFEMFDLEKLDGLSADVQKIINAASTAPVGSRKKVVIVDRVGRLLWDSQSILAGFIARLPQQTCLILLAEEKDTPRRTRAQQAKGDALLDEENEPDENSEEGGKRQKGLRSELVTAIKKHGSYVEFPKPRFDDIETLIQEASRAQGKRIEPAAARVLAQYLASNTSLIDKEIEKLAAYVGERNSITVKDVDDVVFVLPEDRIFRMMDAIADGYSGQALRLLDETLASGAKPENEALRVLAMIARQVRLLYQTKYLMTQPGFRGIDSITDDQEAVLMRRPALSSLHPFQKAKLVEQTRKFSLEELEGQLKQILECELALKGLGEHGGSRKVVLETLVMKLSQRKTTA